jgi:hypothetical protein
MANAPSAKIKKGKRKLLPFYVGVTDSKSLSGKASRHTHYVLIDQRVSTQLGIKGLGIVKPGGSDGILDGVVFQKNRKKSVGDKKPVIAKRYLTQCQKSITVLCKNFVKNKAGVLVQESYSIGFASNIPLSFIIKFFREKAPNVSRISTGGNLYQVR